MTMKILLTGATGFIGGHLAKSLARDGHELVILSRHPDGVGEKLNVPVKAFKWESYLPVPAEALTGVNAVIHLAGEGIAEKRWTEEQKKKILETRVEGTRHLVRAIAAMPGKKPEVVVGASAIGFYGDRGDEVLTEGSAPGTGFLADVCRTWEAELKPLEKENVRTVSVRIGIVLGLEGGALKKMLPIFKTGLAGPVGSGKQWMSWIHVADLVSLFKHAVTRADVKGVVNGVAPTPVTNAEFSKVLGHVLHRPAVLPAPGFALRLAMGELAVLVLGSQKVIPENTRKAGFSWAFPELEPALEDICKKKAVRPATAESSLSSSGSPSR